MAISTTGRTIIDFGAFPGSCHATATVTGMPASAVREDCEILCWLGNEATPEHSLDEHRIEHIRLSADTIVPGVSFRITGMSAEQRTPRVGPSTGKPHRLYGKYSVAFAY